MSGKADKAAAPNRRAAYVGLALLLSLIAWGYISALMTTAQEPWRGDYLNIYIAAHQLVEGEDPYRQASWEAAAPSVLKDAGPASRLSVVSRPQSLLLPPVMLFLMIPLVSMVPIGKDPNG
ncbi:MAG: hypothetical protein P8X52_05165, partial [Limibacillus sp.]